MKLSKTSAQAVLAVAYLASETGTRLIQARQIAKHLCIPTDSALKILQALAHSGLIESRLGRSGGYRFTGSPDRVNLLQIVEAVDGPVTACMPMISQADHLVDRVGVLKSVCERATRQARIPLEQTMVADLIQVDQTEVFNSCG